MFRYLLVGLCFGSCQGYKTRNNCLGWAVLLIRVLWVPNGKANVSGKSPRKKLKKMLKKEESYHEITAKTVIASQHKP